MAGPSPYAPPGAIPGKPHRGNAVWNCSCDRQHCRAGDGGEPIYDGQRTVHEYRRAVSARGRAAPSCCWPAGPWAVTATTVRRSRSHHPRRGRAALEAETTHPERYRLARAVAFELLLAHGLRRCAGDLVRVAEDRHHALPICLGRPVQATGKSVGAVAQVRVSPPGDAEARAERVVPIAERAARVVGVVLPAAGVQGVGGRTGQAARAGRPGAAIAAVLGQTGPRHARR